MNQIARPILQIIQTDNTANIEDTISAIKEAGGRVLFQCDRILLVDLRGRGQEVKARLPRSAKFRLLNEIEETTLNKSELLMLRAIRKRTQFGFSIFEQPKPNEGLPWEEIAFSDEPEPSEILVTSITLGGGIGVNLPTPERLINRNAVAVVIVDSGLPDRGISDEERENIITQLMEATE